MMVLTHSGRQDYSNSNRFNNGRHLQLKPFNAIEPPLALQS